MTPKRLAISAGLRILYACAHGWKDSQQPLVAFTGTQPKPSLTEARMILLNITSTPARLSSRGHRAGGCICLERITQPEAAQAALIHQLDWPLPQQPPPKIYKTDLKNVWTT